MNNTRKEIINLIEDYMNKTLSEWCLVKTKTVQIWWWVVDFWQVLFLDEDGEIGIFYKQANYLYKYNLEFEKEEYFSDWILKIIWHYDMTAVLNYINSKWYEYSKEYNEQIFIVETNIRIDSEWNTIWDFIWSFEIKPLHLYDANEEENLLKLLQSLNNL